MQSPRDCSRQRFRPDPVGQLPQSKIAQNEQNDDDGPNKPDQPIHVSIFACSVSPASRQAHSMLFPQLYRTSIYRSFVTICSASVSSPIAATTTRGTLPEDAPPRSFRWPSIKMLRRCFSGRFRGLHEMIDVIWRTINRVDLHGLVASIDDVMCRACWHHNARHRS